MKSIFGQLNSIKTDRNNDFFLKNISTSEIFEYRGERKQLNAVLLSLSLLGIFIAIPVFYFLPFQSIWKGTIFSNLLDSIIVAIQNKTNFGLGLTSLFGGLFFLVFPLEMYFFSCLRDLSNPWISFLYFYVGLLTAQSINYWLGLRANRFTKLIIPPQKFYKMKGSFNRWGIWMILIMNCLPLPSPIFSTVLGAFKYSFRRFFGIMAIGSFLLYSGMIVIYLAIENIGEEELSWIQF